MAESTKLNFSEGLKSYDEKLKSYLNEKYLLKTDAPSLSNMAFSIDQDRSVQRPDRAVGDGGEDKEAVGNGGLELGYISLASGEVSATLGASSQATGTGAVALGYGSYANGYGSVSAGFMTQSNGMVSFTEGNATIANGSASHAGGNESVAEGNYSFAHGQKVNTIGNYSVALGCETIAGMKAYYYTGINPTAKKIYLSEIDVLTAWDERNLQPAYGDEVTDEAYLVTGFTAPAWNVGDWLGVINKSHYVYNVQVAAVHDNVVEYTGNLGFDRLYAPEDEVDITNSTAIYFFDEQQNVYFTNEGFLPEEPAYCIVNCNGILEDGSSVDITIETDIYSGGYSPYIHNLSDYTNSAIVTSLELISVTQIVGRRPWDTKENSYTVFDLDSPIEGAFAAFHSNIAMGDNCRAIGSCSIAIGRDNIAYKYGCAIGYNNVTGYAGHAEGTNNFAKGDRCHAEGNNTNALGVTSHTEGESTRAKGTSSHAEGYNTLTIGAQSHAEGNNTQTVRQSAHAEGEFTTAYGVGSHAEGNSTIRTRTDFSTADEVKSAWNYNKFLYSFGAGAHAEGKDTLALGNQSHAEGLRTVAQGNFSHTEGTETVASGENSHSGGSNSTATAILSFAHGWMANSSHEGAFVAGNNVKSTGKYQAVFGWFNDAENTPANSVFIIGGGSEENSRKNAMTVNKNGQITLPSSGALTIGSYTITEAQLAQLLNLLNTINVSTSSTTF